MYKSKEGEYKKMLSSAASMDKHRVIHKSVKHFKNSQQINYASDHGNSYADRE
jgi:hypothetical protein